MEAHSFEMKSPVATLELQRVRGGSCVALVVKQTFGRLHHHLRLSRLGELFDARLFDNQAAVRIHARFGSRQQTLQLVGGAGCGVRIIIRHLEIFYWPNFYLLRLPISNGSSQDESQRDQGPQKTRTTRKGRGTWRTGSDQTIPHPSV